MSSRQQVPYIGGSPGGRKMSEPVLQARRPEV